MRLFKNPRVRLAKNPIRAGSYECNNAETNPESPKPNRMPAQLRFRASDFSLQIAAFTFMLCNPLVFFAHFSFQRLTLQICGERGFQLLGDLEIILQNAWVGFCDFFFGRFKSGRNYVKLVAGAYLPCSTTRSRRLRGR